MFSKRLDYYTRVSVKKVDFFKNGQTLTHSKSIENPRVRSDFLTYYRLSGGFSFRHAKFEGEGGGDMFTAVFVEKMPKNR